MLYADVELSLVDSFQFQNHLKHVVHSSKVEKFVVVVVVVC